MRKLTEQDWIKILYIGLMIPGFMTMIAIMLRPSNINILNFAIYSIIIPLVGFCIIITVQRFSGPNKKVWVWRLSILSVTVITGLIGLIFILPNFVYEFGVRYDGSNFLFLLFSFVWFGIFYLISGSSETSE